MLGRVAGITVGFWLNGISRVKDVERVGWENESGGVKRISKSAGLFGNLSASNI